MKFGVIVFPGSNCDHDAYHVISKHVGQPVDFIGHRDTDLSTYDAVILPGGFSYGEYLRAGAIDDLHFAISPVLLGAGERLFDDDLGDATERYECVEATAGEGAMHYRLRRRA